MPYRTSLDKKHSMIKEAKQMEFYLEHGLTRHEIGKLFHRNEATVQDRLHSINVWAYNYGRVCRSNRYHNGASNSYTHKKAQSVAAANRMDSTKCSFCQRQPNAYALSLHHKDGNPSNNTVSNLIYLCGSCHRRVHGARTC